MPRVSPEDWRPRGIEDLEPNAWLALRQPGCACIIAGPGAGKSEFLAQRAVYLLETGACPPPYRVLAISFKSDAAANLSARVRQRCPPELAGRFVSLTFDAFTKGLVDRFITAIPADWRPSWPYDIEFPTRRQVEGFLTQTRVNAPASWQAAIAGLSATDFESRHVGSYRLPLAAINAQSGVDYAVNRWWHGQIKGRARTSLTFVSLNRLAEILLRSNPRLLRALRATYPFVFVDEFQDTTYAQYDFLLSAFANNRTSITAVGDDKQRIMTWAGARPDAFPRFQADFNAAQIPLIFNFRSSPGLVHIQHVVAQAMDGNAVAGVAQAATLVEGDVAQIWRSHTRDAEAQHLARWLADDMARRGRAPREYAVLVRQKSDDYEAELSDELAQAGLRLRNESHALGRTTLQDLLTDELCRIALAVLRLGSQRRAPGAWQIASGALQNLRTVDPEDELTSRKVEAELTTFIDQLQADMLQTVPTQETSGVLAARLFAFLDLKAIARTFLEYGTGDLLAIMVNAFQLHLTASTVGAATWQQCLDHFEGIGQIPLMTVHKSKGLEYDTIIFVGLDDQAWWSYVPTNPEGLATFFVALSRAKQRAIFSFCQQRGRRQRIADLFQLLTRAGVPEISV
jgi:superfamily I DNA/RNA helicase